MKLKNIGLATWVLGGFIPVACDRSPSPPAAASTTVPAASTPVVPASATSPAAASSSPTANATKETVVTFDTDPLGAPSPEFEGVVGDWYVAEDAGGKGSRSMVRSGAMANRRRASPTRPSGSTVIDTPSFSTA